MDKIAFHHGGAPFDEKYPEGIPSQLQIETTSGEKFDSGFVLFPGGHAGNKTVDLNDVLQHKFKLLGQMAMN